MSLRDTRISGGGSVGNQVSLGGATTRNGDNAGSLIISDVASPELSSDTAGTTAEGEAVAVGAASTQSGVITGNFVDVTFAPDATTTLGCYIEIGSNPTAQAGSYYISSNQTYRVGITSGNKIACLQILGAGDIYIHPVE